MFFIRYSKLSKPDAKRVLGAMIVAGILGLSGAVQAQLPSTQHYGNVEYVTGGFGIDESTAMKNAMTDYPLSLTFAARNGSRAAYVSKVQVVVRDQYDATVLNVESQGPFLLARLAPGNYQIHATYQNKTQSRLVTVSDTKGTRLTFEWTRTDDRTEQSPEPVTDAQQEFAPGSIPGLD